MHPLLTLSTHEKLLAARRAGKATIDLSLNLERTIESVRTTDTAWVYRDQHYPYMDSCKDRTIYYWNETRFEPVSKYTTALIKLVPTEWGAPTFEIDGIKMLPTAKVSPFTDAERKVNLIQPRSKIILDTCGGLGYFAAWCICNQAQQVLSFEKNPDVIWLRSLNPWSPQMLDADTQRILKLTLGDITQHIVTISTESIDAALHDPPRFGIAGELYSQDFYDQLARVLKRNGRLFHYTGSPNKLTSGRDVPIEVATRLRRAGFATEISGDGILAIKKMRAKNNQNN